MTQADDTFAYGASVGQYAKDHGVPVHITVMGAWSITHMTDRGSCNRSGYENADRADAHWPYDEAWWDGVRSSGVEVVDHRSLRRTYVPQGS